MFVFSITIDQKGGHYSLPVASAFLLIPPKAVNEKVTLTCSRVRYDDPEAGKPRDEELFVSRILKIEPEGVIFEKPVTVFLSHSLYQDGDYRYFYDLIIENLTSSGCHELKTEQISSIEGNSCYLEHGKLRKYIFSVMLTLHYTGCIKKK